MDGVLNKGGMMDIDYRLKNTAHKYIEQIKKDSIKVAEQDIDSFLKNLKKDMLMDFSVRLQRLQTSIESFQDQSRNQTVVNLTVLEQGE